MSLFVASLLSDNKIEEATLAANTKGAGLVGNRFRLISAAGSAQLKASRDSMLRMSLASLGWLGLVLSQPRCGDAAPWLCFLFVVGTVALARFLHLHQELAKYYCPPTQTKWELHTYISHFFLSGCLLAIVVTVAGFWHWPAISPSKYSRQVVDIELVSAADAVNRKELLPATSLDLKTVRKVSPSSSSSGNALSFPVSASVPTSVPSSKFLLPTAALPSSALSSSPLPTQLAVPQGEPKAKLEAKLNAKLEAQSKSTLRDADNSTSISTSTLSPVRQSPESLLNRPDSQPVSSQGARVDFKLFPKPEVLAPTKTGARAGSGTGSGTGLKTGPRTGSRTDIVSRVKPEPQEPATDNLTESFVTPRGWKTITVSEAIPRSRPAQAATARAPKERKGVSGDASPILSEVTPMDMIESIDSDGERDNTVGRVNFTGGLSGGGKGAPSELAEFLKALNRRIKRYWQPPLGAQRAAQVEFLVHHNGSLAGFKILESSGDRATDRSIALAIEKTFPFQALPTSYKNPTLMVHYSFRYNKLNGDGLVE